MVPLAAGAWTNRKSPHTRLLAPTPSSTAGSDFLNPWEITQPAYIPAIMGLYSVYDAPAEMRMKTLFEEGFGILGGYLGTEAGVALGGALAITVFGLGPFGIFVMVFICATAGGIIVGDLFKKGSSAIYDFGERLGNGQIFYSPEQILGTLR